MNTPDINRILRDNPRPCKYGAPMGAMDRVEELEKLHLQRIKFVDGDYAADGTYWGAIKGEHLWCAFNGDKPIPNWPWPTGAAMHTRIYVRAKTRKLAMALLRDEHDGITFKKGYARP